MSTFYHSGPERVARGQSRMRDVRTRDVSVDRGLGDRQQIVLVAFEGYAEHVLVTFRLRRLPAVPLRDLELGSA